jgi:muramidase (phage lysozyme)
MDAFKLGKTAMDFGSTAMEFLPAMFLANGGAAERKGYAGDDGESGAVIDPGLILSPAARKSIIAEGDAAEGGSDTVALAPAKDVAPPREYKISPQRKEDMEPHWQQFINRTYSGEGGFDKEGKPRYNIRQGGLETFDPETGHPGPGKPRGGESSAAGAGQFIHGTWNRITGGAPMTEAYQDAATRELAMQDYKARTGRDLDADLRERGLSADILGTLSPTWTSFRKDGSPQPAGLTFGRSGEGKYSGKEASQASLGDVVSEFLPKSVPGGANFWVPALSGIGSMLSSKSPYLLGAVGEGLVGGVGGYQSQKKQEQETVKNIFDMVKGRFVQTVDDNMNLVFRDTMTGTMVQPGQVQAAVSNMLTSAGIDPAPYGLGRMQTADASRAGAGAPARQLTDAGTEKKPEAKTAEGAVVEKPKAQEAVAKPVEEWNAGDFRKDVFTNPTRYGFTSGGDNDPNIRLKDIERDRALARKAAMLGIKDESSRLNLQAQEKEKILNEQIKDAYSSDLARVDQQRKDIQANANAYVQDIKKSGDAYVSARQQAIKLSEAFSRAQMGPGSDVKAYVTGLAKTFGFSLPEKFNSDAEAIAYANKLAMKNVVEQAAASNLLRAPKAVLGSMEQINATSKMDPNAAYRLLGDMIGEMDYVHGRNTDYLKNHRGKEPAIHGSQYDAAQGDKGYKTTLAKAYSELAIPQDPNAAKTVRDIYSELSEYGYKPRLEKQKAAPSGGEAKTEAPAAPAVPAPLQSMEGLQYSASRNQYRDKAGNVYDASGKRVQ